MHQIKEKLKNSPRVKAWVLWLLMPRNQAKPRTWVTWLVNPFLHRKGRNSLINRLTRMDILPFNQFSLGNDSTIEDFATVNNGVGDVFIGDRTRIGLGCVLIGPVRVGNDVMLAQNIVVSGLNHGYEAIDVPISQQKVKTAPIILEDEVWIGANAVITAGVTIGKHAVVAAGSVVTKDVPSYSVVAGNPAKVLKQYNPATGQWERVKAEPMTTPLTSLNATA